jgi:hypothetical protein
LFVALPHVFPEHAVTLSGAQQVSFERQTSVPGHDEQPMVWPQLLVAVVLHLPAHAVTLSGVQHELPMHTWLDEEQLGVPPDPHATTWPQLFVALPHVLPLHVTETGSGTQPHEPASLQVRPPSHPPQLIGSPQLSVLAPQRFWHHVEGGVGEQQAPEAHTPPSAHAEHCTICPQLFATVPLHLFPHAVALSGVQQVSFPRQTSVLAVHVCAPFAPQPTVCPQLFVAEPQFLPLHVLAAGSGMQPHAPCVQDSPPSQPPQFTGFPQLSTSAPQRFVQNVASGTHPSPDRASLASSGAAASASPASPAAPSTPALPSTVVASSPELASSP